MGPNGERIRVLLNSKATRAAILDEFKRLAEQEEPVFLKLCRPRIFVARIHAIPTELHDF